MARQYTNPAPPPWVYQGRNTIIMGWQDQDVYYRFDPANKEDVRSEIEIWRRRLIGSVAVQDREAAEWAVLYWRYTYQISTRYYCEDCNDYHYNY